MTKRNARDRLILRAISVTLVILIVGFGLAWMYIQREERMSREINFLTLSSVAISRDGHSMSAGIAIRTSAADAEWAKANQGVLEQAMKSALLEVDPVKVRQPGGLKNLQETLRVTSNATLQTTRVQEVIVTDFLVSEGDM